MPIAGGSVTQLATGLSSPAALALGDTSAFWTEPGAPVGCCLRVGAGSVKQVSLGGGIVSTTISGLDAPAGLSVGSANLVWTEAGRIGKASPDGSSVATLASGIGSDMVRIAVDQTSVYALDGDYIKKLPLAGGTVEVLASARLGSIGDSSMWNLDIATDGTNVYWTIKENVGLPTVQKVPISGGAPVTLASEPAMEWGPQDSYRRIVVDSQHVYWSSSGKSGPISGAVKKVPISGGSVTTLVDYPYLADFSVDGSNVYFSELASNAGSIRKVSLSGGVVSSPMTTRPAWVLANDASRLYWIDERYGMVGLMSKTGDIETAPTFIPGALQLDWRALEGLFVDSSGLYVTETHTGNIYFVY